MGAPPEQPNKGFTPAIDREPGTREDGEALPPTAIDPAPNETPEDDPPASGTVKDATGF